MDKTPVQTAAILASADNKSATGVRGGQDVFALFCNLAQTPHVELFELGHLSADRVRAIESQASLLKERSQFGLDSVSECLAVALHSGELSKHAGANVAWTLKLLQELVISADMMMYAAAESGASAERQTHPTRQH